MSATGARLAGLAMLVAVVILATPERAEAHTRTQEVTNVVSALTTEPEIDGVSWTVHTGGLLITAENRTDAVLVVRGYDGEPYLRIGPQGVERNRRSPTTYLNDERFTARTGRDVADRAPAMPTDVDPDAEPEWVAHRDEPVATWHDHRTHWMSPAPPRFVEASPVSRAAMRMRLVGPIGVAGSDAGVFATWEVPAELDGRPAGVTGELAWQDPPPMWPWLLAALVLTTPAVAGWRRLDSDLMVRPAAVVVATVAVVNGVHLVDDVLAWPTPVVDELFGVLHTATFLAAGLGGAVWAWSVTGGRRLALGIASGALLYHQGVVHLPMLAASQFPTVWPPQLVRLTVALGIMQALWVGVVLLRTARAGDRVATTVPEQPPATAADADRHPSMRP